MKIAEAESRIIGEFISWRDKKGITNATGTDALMFYGYLTTHRRDLLSFTYRGDKWQRVHGFLLHARLVSD
jgi:hypothetical protein